MFVLVWGASHKKNQQRGEQVPMGEHLNTNSLSCHGGATHGIEHGCGSTRGRDHNKRGNIRTRRGSHFLIDFKQNHMSHVVVTTVMATTTCSDIDTLAGVSTTSATTAMLSPMCGSTVAALTVGIYMFRLGICFPKMLIRARLRR